MMKTRRNINLLSALLIAASVMCACKSQYEALLNSNDEDAKYEAAFQFYNTGKFTKSAQLFESLSMLTGGTERDDTVRFYWGMSNYRSKDYITAETNFTRFIESFPRSPFASEARFLRLDCLYRSTYRYELDQSPTYAALNAIYEYMSEYPNSSHIVSCRKMSSDLEYRLDTKAYESAWLYYHMEDYLASRVALRNVLKDDAENVHREKILYYIAMSSYKYAYFSVSAKQKERYLVFVDDYLNFIGELPDSKYRKELDALYLKARKAIGKDAMVTDDLYKKEKDFARERKQEQRKKKSVQNGKKN